MVGALDLIAMEGEKSVDFGEEGVSVVEIVVVEIDQAGFDEVELFLIDGLEDVFVVEGEEKELAASATLSLHQVEHLLGVALQFERLENVLESVLVQEHLEHFRSVDEHRALQNPQPG